MEPIVMSGVLGVTAAGVRALLHWFAARERERVFSRALRTRRTDVTVEYRGGGRDVRMAIHPNPEREQR